MQNRLEKKIIFDDISSLEQSIYNDIRQAFFAMDNSMVKEFPDIARKYAVGNKIMEYHNTILKLQADYIGLIVTNLEKYQYQKGVSKEILAKCLGYLIGPRENI